jgi:hypothetical protein
MSKNADLKRHCLVLVFSLHAGINMFLFIPQAVETLNVISKCTVKAGGNFVYYVIDYSNFVYYVIDYSNFTCS